MIYLLSCFWGAVISILLVIIVIAVAVALPIFGIIMLAEWLDKNNYHRVLKLAIWIVYLAGMLVGLAALSCLTGS